MVSYFCSFQNGICFKCDNNRAVSGYRNNYRLFWFGGSSTMICSGLCGFLMHILSWCSWSSFSLWLDTFSFGKCLANISSNTDSASFLFSLFQVSSYMYARSFSSHLICFLALLCSLKKKKATSSFSSVWSFLFLFHADNFHTPFNLDVFYMEVCQFTNSFPVCI